MREAPISTNNLPICFYVQIIINFFRRDDSPGQFASDCNILQSAIKQAAHSVSEKPSISNMTKTNRSNALSEVTTANG